MVARGKQKSTRGKRKVGPIPVRTQIGNRDGNKARLPLFMPQASLTPKKPGYRATALTSTDCALSPIGLSAVTTR